MIGFDGRSNYGQISNWLVRKFITGAAKEACPPTKSYFFADIRDVALSHVLAAEKNEAAEKRFLIVADKYCNKQIVEAIYANFPGLRDRLPKGEVLKPDDFIPHKFSATGMPDCGGRRSMEVLGMSDRPLVESVVDAVKLWQAANLDYLFPHILFRRKTRPPRFLYSN